MLGVYGVVAYTAVRQQRDIGIRLALGATRTNVRVRFVRQALALAAVGIVAPSILCSFVNRTPARSTGRSVRRRRRENDAADADIGVATRREPTRRNREPAKQQSGSRRNRQRFAPAGGHLPGEPPCWPYCTRGGGGYAFE